MHFLIRVIVIFIIFFLFINFVDMREIPKFFSQDILWGMIANQPLLLIGIIPIGMRLSLFACKNQSLLKTSCKASILSIGLNVIIPVRLSEFIKPIILNLDANVKISAGISALFLERISDLMIIVLISFFAISFTWLKISINYLCLLIGFIVLLLCLLKYSKRYNLTKFIPWKNIRKLYVDIIKNISENLKNGVLKKGLFYGSLGWVCSFLSVFIFMKVAGSIELSIFECLILFLATTLAIAVPSLPSGVGSFEAGATWVLQSNGYSIEEAFVLSVGLHISQLVLAVVLSVLFIIFSDYSFKELRANLKRIKNLKSRDICD